MKKLELYSVIYDNNSAIRWCRERKILISHAICPACSQEMQEVSSKCINGIIWSCRRTFHGSRHQKKLSIRHGSVLSNRNLSLKNNVYLLYEWAVKSSADQASYELSISKPTVI